MKQIVVVAVTAALAVAATATGTAQARGDFAGEWVLNQARSGQETRGISPQVSFPTEVVITLTGADLHMETSSNHQDPEKHVFKLDGTEASTTVASGTKITGKAVWDGPGLLITSKRSFSSPMGDITAEYTDRYSVADGLLTVERTQVTGGETLKGKAVYTKATS